MNKTRKQKTKVRQHTEHGPRDCQNKKGNRHTKKLGLNKGTGKWKQEKRHKNKEHKEKHWGQKSISTIPHRSK